MQGFIKKDPDQITNIFDLIEEKWMLITAGNKEKFNTMLASWGGFGVLWFKKVAIVFIREERYTHEFVENNDSFTLSFFLDGYRDELKLCGTVSGRDHDKVKETSFTPVFGDDTVYFNEADIVLECKKIYSDSLMAENFIDKQLGNATYPNGVGHTMYIGEITNVLVKE